MSESLTLVDHDDNVMGTISKVEGHLKTVLKRKDAMPHRAFSLFHFNKKN